MLLLVMTESKGKSFQKEKAKTEEFLVTCYYILLHVITCYDKVKRKKFSKKENEK